MQLLCFINDNTHIDYHGSGASVFWQKAWLCPWLNCFRIRYRWPNHAFHYDPYQQKFRRWMVSQQIIINKFWYQKLFRENPYHFYRTYRIVGFICLGCDLVACILVKDRIPRPRIRKKLGDIIQFSVFRDSRFRIWCLGATMQMVGYFIPFFFVPCKWLLSNHSLCSVCQKKVKKTFPIND